MARIHANFGIGTTTADATLVMDAAEWKAFREHITRAADRVVCKDDAAEERVVLVTHQADGTDTITTSRGMVLYGVRPQCVVAIGDRIARTLP